MRNNEERTGAKFKGAEAPVPQVNTPPPPSEPSNNLLQFVAPTDFVDLPSGGKFYAEDHPLHNKECIEIRQMTAKDEDILTSQTLIQKGVAVDRLLQNLLVDNVDIDSLLVGDKNAVIMAARINGYGAQYDTKVQCPICTNYSEYSFDLNENVKFQSVDENYEDLGAKKTSSNTFMISLPASKVEVEVKLLTSGDEKKLARHVERIKKLKLPESTLTDQIKMFVTSANGETNPSVVSDFVDHMPAKDSRFLRDLYSKLIPNVDMKQSFTCFHCNSEMEMEVPFSADFFWPR